MACGAATECMLDFPYLAGEEDQINFSLTVSGDLAVAYDFKQAGQWSDVLRILKRLRPEHCAQAQRLRINYLHGLAENRQGHSVAAERALRLAVSETGADDLTQALVHAELALALHNQQRLPDAIEVYQVALVHLERATRFGDARSLALQDEILLNIAGECLCRLQIEEGLRYLDRAEELLETPLRRITWEVKRQRANVLWMKALVFRWKSEPEVGFDLAHRAINLLTEVLYQQAATGAPTFIDALSRSLARLNLVAADCLMDAVETGKGGRIPVSPLPTTRQFIADAQMRLSPQVSTSGHLPQHAQHTQHDDAGVLLARLAWLRYQRLAKSGAQSERLNALYSIVRKVSTAAEKDQALIGQAELTFADELAFQGNRAYARIYYGDAIEHLDTVAPMLAMRARNARSALDH